MNIRDGVENYVSHIPYDIMDQNCEIDQIGVWNSICVGERYGSGYLLENLQKRFSKSW